MSDKSYNIKKEIKKLKKPRWDELLNKDIEKRYNSLNPNLVNTIIKIGEGLINNHGCLTELLRAAVDSDSDSNEGKKIRIDYFLGLVGKT